MRRALVPLLLAACAKSPPPPQDPAVSVSVAPQSTGSPNEPLLLVGPQPQPEPPGELERVKVRDEQPDAAWKPPKDRCPEGITEMMSVHVPIGRTMELAPGGAPVSALGGNPDVAELTFDPRTKTVHVTARKYGLVYVTVERDGRCTLYGVNTGY